MAGNSRPSFTKRQKERSRQEKQAEKAQKRLQRKQEKPLGEAPEGEVAEAKAQPAIELDEFGMPKGLDFHDF
jgi:hypothetical protein